MISRLALACVLLVAATAHAAEPHHLPKGERLGAPIVLQPTGAPTAVVYLFSDSDGWGPSMDATASALVDEGAVVVPIDAKAYRAALDASDGDCLYVISEIEVSSRTLQSELGIAHYMSPILAGTGFGAGLAYAALAQSPAATIAGALSDGFVDHVETRQPFCPGAQATRIASGGFHYGPTPRLPGFWRVGLRYEERQGLAASTALRLHERLSLSYEQANDMTTRVILGQVPPAERMLELFRQAMAEDVASATDALPLIELESGEPGDLLAIVYSGDGGWRDLDKQVGEYLAEHGVPTVGIDSLRYFWTERPVGSMAADLERVIATYGERWKRKRVLLVGYSFGANLLPFIVDELSPQTRASIVRVGLLALAQTTPMVVGIGEWLGVADPATLRPISPEVAKLEGLDVVCIYGADEKDSGCRDPAFDRLKRAERPGGHHFGGDYVAIAKTLLEGLK